MHPPAVDLDFGVAIAVPLPLRRSTDRIHDQLAKHFGQWATPQPQQGEAQPVYPDVVVFPEFSGRPEIAVAALRRRARTAADRAVAVDQVRLVPQRAFPFRGLLQEVVPGDRVVVRRIETAVIDPAADLLVRVADQPAVPGETGKHREIALGDAERHVDARRVAPLGNDEPVAQQDTVRAAARTHRAEGLVPRGPLFEITGDHPAEISAPWCFVLASLSRRGGNRVGVEPGFGGRRVLPSGRVGRREIGHGRFLSLNGVELS